MTEDVRCRYTHGYPPRRFFGLVQLGYREVLKQFNDMQERDTTATGLFSGDVGGDLGDEEVDMSEGTHIPVTPPADAPAPVTPKAKGRALTKVVSRGRAVSRHGSLGGMVPEPVSLKDNPFTTVPANFNPQSSPQRKGKRKEQEKVKEQEVKGESGTENLPLPTPTSSWVEKAEAVPKEDGPGFPTLPLGLEEETEEEQGSRSRRASRSPPRKKTRS